MTLLPRTSARIALAVNGSAGEAGAFGSAGPMTAWVSVDAKGVPVST